MGFRLAREEDAVSLRPYWLGSKLSGVVAHLLDGVPTLTTSLPYVFERAVSALPQSNVDRAVNRRKEGIDSH